LPSDHACTAQGKENVHEKGDNCRLQAACGLKDNVEISEIEIETASTRSGASRICAGPTENATPRYEPRDMGCDVTGLAVALAARVASLEEELASKDRQLTELQHLHCHPVKEPPMIPSPSRAWAWSRIGPVVDSPDSPAKGERSPIPASDPKPPASASIAARRPASPEPKRQPLQAQRVASPRLSALAAPTAKAAAALRGSSPKRRPTNTGPLPASTQKQSLSPRCSDAGVKRVAARSTSPGRSTLRPSGSLAEVGPQAPSSPRRPSPRRLCSGLSPRWPLEEKIAATAQADPAAYSASSPALQKDCAGVQECGPASAPARKAALARVVHRPSPVKSPVSSRPTPLGKRTTTKPDSKRAFSPSPPAKVSDSAVRGKALEAQARDPERLGLQRDYSKTWLSIKESHLKSKAVDVGRDGAVSQGGVANTSNDDFLSIERLVNDGAITLDADPSL